MPSIHDHDADAETDPDTDHDQYQTPSDREPPSEPMGVIYAGGEEYAVWRDMPYEQYLEVRQALNREEEKLRDFIVDNRVSLPTDSESTRLDTSSPDQ